MVFDVKSHILRQYVIVIVANFTYLCFGLETGWASPVIAKLKEVNQTVLPHPISDHDAAWVVSIGLLVGVFVMLFTGYLMDRLGRKVCFIIANLPRLANCFLMVFASEAWMILLARSLNGVSDVFGMCLVFTYTSEIANKEIRGALGTIAQMSFAVGTMLMLTVGPFLSYLSLNIMVTVIVVVLFVPVFFLPETPYFLYSKGRKEESIKILTDLRGSKEAAYEELNDYSENSTSIDKLKLLRDKTMWKSLGRGFFLVIGAQFTGYNSLSFYLQSVFASTHSSIAPEMSSLIIGCTELLACFCTIFLTDRCGRKPVLTISLTLMAVGMVGLGTFFYLKEHNYVIKGFLDYLPLLSIMLSIFCFNAGIGSIMMMYIAELFDGPSRAIGVSITLFVASIFTFLVIRYFAAVASALGPTATYYGFSIGCLIMVSFIAFCLPETKGKSFNEIQKEIKGESEKEIEGQEEKKSEQDKEGRRQIEGGGVNKSGYDEYVTSM